jgi:hypothetical protein
VIADRCLTANIVGDPLAGELERGAFGSAAVLYAQVIVAAPIEGEASETAFRQHRRRGPRRADVKFKNLIVLP